MAVNEAIESGALLNPGTRELVLYLAQHRQSPLVAKADKSGWEAVDRYMYAFYDTAKFTRFAVPDATSFKGCQQQHRFIGLCGDRRRAELDGPLRVAKGYCACDPCLLLETDDCLLPQLVGKAVRAKAPLAKGAPVRVPQMLSLTKYAEWLGAKRLVAVNVDESESELEGPYWLALLSGDAFTVEEDMMYAGQQYRAGWIVAPGRWYKLRQQSERGYELLPDEARAATLCSPRHTCLYEPHLYRVAAPVRLQVLLVVNHMIFLKDLTFSSSQSGPQGRELRKTATGPAAASRAKGSGLSFLSEDTHNVILDALGLNASG